MSIEKFNFPSPPAHDPEGDEEMLQRIIQAAPVSSEALTEQQLPPELNPGTPGHRVFNDPRKMPDPTIPDPAVSPENAYPPKPPETIK